MVLSDFGKIADECWRAIPKHFPNVELGAHVIMPNHVHGILIFHEVVGAQHIVPLWDCCAPTPDNHKITVKQRITDYIEANPSRWNDDDENPSNNRG